MIKNILIKVALASVLLSSSLVADLAYSSEPNSLIGIEVGSSFLDVTQKDGTYDETLNNIDFGFKVGAETDNYRLFLSYRYYDGDLRSLTTLGAELQYMIEVASFMNIYLGVNVGMVDIEFIDTDNYTRVVSQNYIGGDAGFNFHLGENFDLELGARLMDIQADHLLDGKTYTFGSLVTGYGSLIYKFKMDK